MYTPTRDLILVFTIPRYTWMGELCIEGFGLQIRHKSIEQVIIFKMVLKSHVIDEMSAEKLFAHVHSLCTTWWTEEKLSRACSSCKQMGKGKNTDKEPTFCGINMGKRTFKNKSIVSVLTQQNWKTLPWKSSIINT